MFRIRQFIKEPLLWMASSCLVAVGVILGQANSVRGQSQPNPSYCQRPLGTQLTLYVNTPTPSASNWVRSHFSANNQGSIRDCLSGQGSNFTTIVGFVDRAQAQGWQNYFDQTLRTQTYLFPPLGQLPTPAPPETFKPRLLASQGYSVLVDYQNNPSLVEGLKAYTNEALALTSFVGRPYLLVTQNKEQSGAIATAESLSRDGYWVFVVKSAEVTLLSDKIY